MAPELLKLFSGKVRIKTGIVTVKYIYVNIPKVLVIPVL